VSPDRSDRDHRLLLASTGRRWLVAATAAISIVGGPLIAFSTPSSERDFVTVAGPVQLLISVTLGFVGVSLAADVRRQRAQAGPAVRAAFQLAIAAAVFVAVICVVAISVAGSTASEGPWLNVPTAFLGGLGVQLLSQVIGLGFGAVISGPLLAGLATLVPVAAWALLGRVEALIPVREWLTPVAVAKGLLAGNDPSAWVRAAVVVLLWGGALWLAGAGPLLFGQHGDSAAG
jgi:hypothetical protein